MKVRVIFTQSTSKTADGRLTLSSFPTARVAEVIKRFDELGQKITEPSSFDTNDLKSCILTFEDDEEETEYEFEKLSGKWVETTTKEVVTIYYKFED